MRKYCASFLAKAFLIWDVSLGKGGGDADPTLLLLLFFSGLVFLRLAPAGADTAELPEEDADPVDER